MGVDKQREQQDTPNVVQGVCVWTNSVSNKTHLTWYRVCVCVDKQREQQDTPNVVQGVCVWTNRVRNKTHLTWVQGVCVCGQTG